MSQTADVVVIGAGVIGGCVAYYLSQAGLRVCVMERDGVGSGASAHGHGVTSLVGKDFKPGAHFLLGVEGLRVYPEFTARLVEETGIDPLFHQMLGVSLALTDEEEGIYREAMSWQQQHVEMRWAGIDEVRQIEQRITPQARGGVLYYHSQVDGYRLSLAAVRAVEQRGGSLLLREATGLQAQGDRVTGVKYPGGVVECGAVVVAAGAWSAIARGWLNFPIPVRPLHGQVLHVRLRGEPLRLFVLTARHGPILQRRDGILMVGSIGGVSMSGLDVDKVHVFDPRDQGPWEFDLNPSAWGKSFMLEKAVHVMPELENAELVAHLAGVRPLCADRMPLLGAVPGWRGVFLATGHGTKGIHLAPVTGRIMADLVLRGKTEAPVPVEAFSPARFASFRPCSKSPVNSQ
ncbi:MAG: FAD-dependent oxidoreductase [Chloroflexi bacterium]|nr:FAD-dependent oxidoreductase [Chloroflexota bacterium]